MVHFWEDGFLCGLDPRKRKLIAVERESSNATSMILSQHDIRTAVKEKQIKEASVDLRLGFRLVRKA